MVQLWYAMSRDWARFYCGDIVAGAYSKEELNESGFADSDNVTQPTDLSPRLRERLQGQRGEGFAGALSIEKQLAAATPQDGKKKAGGATDLAGQDAAAEASEVPGPAASPAGPAP